MTDDQRQRPARNEIEITSQMIEAGVYALRTFHFGQAEAEIVEAVFIAMMAERYSSSSASRTSPST